MIVLELKREKKIVINNKFVKEKEVIIYPNKCQQITR